MGQDLFIPLWLALFAVAYVFVCAVLSTVTGIIRNQTERHMLIRNARTRRLDYLRQLAQRREQQNV